MNVLPLAAVPNSLPSLAGSGRQAISDAGVRFYGQILEFAPQVIVAVVILMAGFAIAKLLSRMATALGQRLGLEAAAERSGLSTFIAYLGFRRSISSIVGSILFWLLMCVAIMAGFKVLGLAAVSSAMAELVSYIPNILLATVVLVLGLLVATLLRGIIADRADRVGVSYAQPLADACYYTLTAVTGLAAARHLGLQFDLLEKLILIAFGAVAVGFALALGLGGRDVMAGILAGHFVRQRFAAGDRVRFADIEGIVREVGPVATVIEMEQDGLLHRRSVPNRLMLKQAVR